MSGGQVGTHTLSLNLGGDKKLGCLGGPGGPRGTPHPPCCERMGFGEAAEGWMGKCSRLCYAGLQGGMGMMVPKRWFLGSPRRVEECTCMMQHQVAGVGIIRVTMCVLVQPD